MSSTPPPQLLHPDEAAPQIIPMESESVAESADLQTADAGEVENTPATVVIPISGTEGETANATPPAMETDESTRDSSVLAADATEAVLAAVESNMDSISSVPSTPAPEKRTLNRLITEDVTYKITEPKDIVEYEWPPKSGEKWLIQEQISELLDIKGFKRKYADLTSRTIKKEEKEFLINTHQINNLLSELHMQFMTALRSTEVHDMLGRDFPVIYSEYQRIATEKMKERMAELQKEMDIVKQDPKLLEELRQKAMKSAVEYNSELQQYKKSERGSFWDTQTSILQSSARKWKCMPPEITRPNPYPVALVHGQYQHYYRRFTPAEIRRLPLGTVLDGENLFPVYKEPSPPPINVKQEAEELQKASSSESVQSVPSTASSSVAPAKEGDFQDGVPAQVLAAANMPASLNNKNMETPPRSPAVLLKTEKPGKKVFPESITPRQQDLRKLKCTSCGQGRLPDTLLVRCSSCHMIIHAECAEMSEEMSHVVLNYPWNCLDCKTCTICKQPDHEEALMFCDRCDRGYHTFCVGLNKPPTGSWICERFCEEERKMLSTTSSGRRANRRSLLAE